MFKNRIRRGAVALLSTLSALPALAQVEVSQAWTRATVAQQKATGVFLQMKSAQDVRLLEVHSPLAGVAEVHEMVMEGSTMKMRSVPALSLPAGKLVELKPGSLHLMLMDLKRPISVDEKVPVTLLFEDAKGQRQTLDVQATARQMGMGH